MTRPAIVVGPADRVLVLGQTGSGKSTLVRALFYGHRALVVVDPKHEELLPRSITVYTPADFRRVYPQRSTRVVFRPNPEDPRSDDVDEIIRRVLAYGRTRVVFHEMVGYAGANRVVPAVARLWKTGRTLLAPAVACSQRPIGLHNDVIAESEHVFAFDLALEGDRRKVAGIGGDGFLERPADKYGFLYYGPGTGGRVVSCPPLAAPPPQAQAEPTRPAARPSSA